MWEYPILIKQRRGQVWQIPVDSANYFKVLVRYAAEERGKMQITQPIAVVLRGRQVFLVVKSVAAVGYFKALISSAAEERDSTQITQPIAVVTLQYRVNNNTPYSKQGTPPNENPPTG